MNLSVSESSAIPPAALWLGYSGLVPFVVLAVALWFLPGPEQTVAHDALLAYAAIILSFMGAVHWGLAMNSSNPATGWQFGASVVPPLLAWFAIFTPPLINSGILIAAFAGLCAFDGYVARTGGTPAWYPRLRVPLTAVVVISLIVAQIAVS